MIRLTTAQEVTARQRVIVTQREGEIALRHCSSDPGPMMGQELNVASGS